MLRFKLYRLIRVFLGARSFVKIQDTKNSYALLSGTVTDALVTDLKEIGFVEEWPLTRSE